MTLEELDALLVRLEGDIADLRKPDHPHVFRAVDNPDGSFKKWRWREEVADDLEAIIKLAQGEQ